MANKLTGSTFAITVSIIIADVLIVSITMSTGNAEAQRLKRPSREV